VSDSNSQQTPNRIFVSKLGIYFRGGAMGCSDIVPGVSGGTMALLLGVYERLVTALSRVDATLLRHLFRREFRKAVEYFDLVFLVTLGLGVASGIALMTFLLDYLLKSHLVPTMGAFFGLITASGFLVFRKIGHWHDADRGRTIKNVVIRLLAMHAGIFFAWWLVGLPALSTKADPPLLYGYLVLCGMISISAMILPGISGAFILLILGQYKFIVGTLKEVLSGHFAAQHLYVVLSFALGAALGLITFSKFLKWLLEKWHDLTMAVLCGFMFGALRLIWPWKEAGIEALFEKKEDATGFVNVWPNLALPETHTTIAVGVAALFFVLAIEWYAARKK